MSKILITGGAGYIGSHMCVELARAGLEFVVVDNLINSSKKSLAAVKRITNQDFAFVEADLRDEATLNQLFSDHEINAVLHFGGLKAVGESVEKPLEYYDNNVQGTLCLLRAMSKAEVITLVFSSSATVYGIPTQIPLTEDCATSATNPYGQTKLIIEEMLQNFAQVKPDWRISMLRYFNPVGAHVSGELGEDPNGIPNNLMPFISQVAVGKLQSLKIFGQDWETRDGTGVRDYIHVEDLAKGHLKALTYLESNPGIHIHNLGTGTGYSVLEVVHAFEKANGVPIPHEFAPRRSGDIAECYADATKAKIDLGWQAKHDITRMCEDVWRWQSRHPNGFE